MTFIEILIVVSLLALIGGFFYRSLSQGLKIWKESRSLVLEQDIAIFFEKITYDLKNTFYYSRIGFAGKENQLTFATFVPTPAEQQDLDEDAGPIDQIGKVEYLFDYNQKKLFKRIADYSQALRGNFQPEQLILSSLDNVTFRYFHLDSHHQFIPGDYSESIPSAVEIQVSYSDETGKKIVQKMISIPVGI